jgi:crotonobetainyl-CoA:carnitine CoA-transferase CaiB-like acyl-CoA transferase
MEPVLSLAESEQNPQVQARGLLHTAEDGLRRVGYPAKIDGRRPRAADEFPALGEHTDAIVQEFGLAADVPMGKRKRRGIGKRRSVKAWAMRVATKVASKWSSDEE